KDGCRAPPHLSQAQDEVVLFVLTMSLSQGAALITSPVNGGGKEDEGRLYVDQLAEFPEIDVTARDDGDDRALSGLAAQRGGQGECACTFGHHAALFRQRSHGAARFVQC